MSRATSEIAERLARLPPSFRETARQVLLDYTPPSPRRTTTTTTTTKRPDHA